MIKSKNEVIEVSTGEVTPLGADENLIKKANEELKEFFKSDVNYKMINDNLYINRAWINEDKEECLCLTLNDTINVYVDENINVIYGDVITGEWEVLNIEELNKVLNYILNYIECLN